MVILLKVGAVLSIFTVSLVVHIFPALSFVVNVTVVPVVSDVNEVFDTTVDACPLSWSLPFVFPTVTFDLYHSLFPNVPDKLIVPHFGGVLSSLRKKHRYYC